MDISYMNTHTSMHNAGWIHNERLTPSIIESIRWDLIQRRRAYTKAHWNPWWNYLKNNKIEKFWGYQGKRISIFELLDNFSGLTHDYIDFSFPYEFSKLYKVIPDSELPLHINDTMNTEARDIYRARCSGALKQVPYMQDYVDDYFKTELRYQRLNDALGICDTILEDYILHEFVFKEFRDEKYLDKIIRLIINGRQYLYHLKLRGENTVKLLVPPEDVLYTKTLP